MQLLKASMISLELIIEQFNNTIAPRVQFFEYFSKTFFDLMTIILYRILYVIFYDSYEIVRTHEDALLLVIWRLLN